MVTKIRDNFFKTFIGKLVAGTILASLWFIAFRIADIFPQFKTYSSIWFLPAGVTLSVVLAAPGWLKLIPLLANLSLAFPQVRATVGVVVLNDYEPLLHGIRLYVVYGAAALVMVHGMKLDLPARSWRDVQWFIGFSLFAAFVATLAGEAMHIAAGNMTWPEAIGLFQNWWLGDALGVLMVAPILVPVLLAAFGRDTNEWQWPSTMDWLVQAALILSALFLGLWGSTAGLTLWYLVIPIIILSALIGGYEKAASAILLAGFFTPLMSFVMHEAITVTELAVSLLTASVAALLVGAATSDRQKTEAALTGLVAQRTEELEKAYELQRHLVRSLGHDLRQPIEALNLTLEGLSTQVTTPLKQKAVDRARELGSLTSNLLNRILAYARLDMGSVEPIEQQFPVRQLFNRLETTYGPLADAKGIDILWEPADMDLVSDPELLFQVLSNHLDNAIRLSRSGARITVKTEYGPQEIGLFVIDTLDASVPKRAGAAGLGLQISGQIAELLGAESVVAPNRRGIVLKNHLQRGS